MKSSGSTLFEMKNKSKPTENNVFNWKYWETRGKHSFQVKKTDDSIWKTFFSFEKLRRINYSVEKPMRTDWKPVFFNWKTNESLRKTHVFNRKTNKNTRNTCFSIGEQTKTQGKHSFQMKKQRKPEENHTFQLKNRTK